MHITIRPATQEDGTAVVEMVKGLQIHLGETLEGFDEARFIEDAFGDEPQFTLLVAVEDDGESYLGYTLFHDAYEPAYAARGVYLSDLYVSAEARGKGIGKLLLQAVARDADARGRVFIWLVSPQEDARAFYDNVMDIREEVVVYALTDKHFKRLVEES